MIKDRLVSFNELFDLSPRGFEKFVALHLLPELGYVAITLTDQTGDSGFDISARDNEKIA